MQWLIALGGMALLFAAVLSVFFAIAWGVLLAVRHLPLVGRRGRSGGSRNDASRN